MGDKIRFGLIGTGWRAEFFIRIAKEMPEQFVLTNVLCRSAEKGKAFSEKMGVSVVNRVEDLLGEPLDFVVLSVTKAATPDYLHKLAAFGVPVLCETPPSTDKETLYRLWDMACQTGAKIQIAEQYYLQPLYQTWLAAIEKGMIGTVSNMRLSACHTYHALSLFRKILGVGMQPLTISGQRFQFPLVETDSRDGLIANGETVLAPRDVVTFAWEDGKIGFYDFSGKQYHSSIRTRHLNIQGERGEIDDMDIRYINAQGDAVTASLSRIDRGIYDIPVLSHQHISLNGEVLYHNPFLYKRFNDDEIAMASALVGMARYLKTGEEVYSLADGLQDALIAIAIEEAVTTGKTVVLPKQPWAK